MELGAGKGKMVSEFTDLFAEQKKASQFAGWPKV
jgi:hypothetical protein